MTTYREQLRDPRWQKKRLEILSRDDWACRHCGATKRTLHVHHMEYVGSAPWETPASMLKTICERCHSALHDDWAVQVIPKLKESAKEQKISIHEDFVIALASISLPSRGDPHSRLESLSHVARLLAYGTDE